MKSSLEELSLELVRLARSKGAEEVECTVSEGEEFSVNVRMREVENIKQAGSRGAGLRVLLGQQSGSAYTSDLSREGIDRMVESALAAARVATTDPHAGLPDADTLGALPGELGLYSKDLEQLSEETKIRQALEAEEAALSFDARIVNSEGGSFSSHLSSTAFANSRGFSGSYRTSSCSISVVPVAREGSSMERDYWYTLSRSHAALESPAEVGRTAAGRAIRRLNPRRIATQKAPVIFDPRAARSLLDHIFESVEGNAIYRNASFLAGCLGNKVASDHVTVINDATIPGLFGTCPFDDEGVPSRRTVVIERGVLKSYLLNTYTARKLGLKTTGNASRGLSGNAGIGHGNFYMEPGPQPAPKLIESARNGLYVTELMGFGVNTVTGDYSRGAVGLWIENGELAYPVSEVTIAGNLRHMLLELEAVGDDLEFRGSIASPTLLIREMTISGQ